MKSENPFLPVQIFFLWIVSIFPTDIKGKERVDEVLEMFARPFM